MVVPRKADWLRVFRSVDGDKTREIELLEVKMGGPAAAESALYGIQGITDVLLSDMLGINKGFLDPVMADLR